MFRSADSSNPAGRTPEILVWEVVGGSDQARHPRSGNGLGETGELLSVSATWAWWSSRPTVAMASVLGMMVSKVPDSSPDPRTAVLSVRA